MVGHWWQLLRQRDRRQGALRRLARRRWPQLRWWRQRVICIRGRSVCICICIRRSIGAARRRIRIQIRSFSPFLRQPGMSICQSTQTRPDPFSTSIIPATEVIQAPKFESNAAFRHDRFCAVIGPVDQIWATATGFSDAPLHHQKLDISSFSINVVSKFTIIGRIVRQPDLRDFA